MPQEDIKQFLARRGLLDRNNNSIVTDSIGRNLDLVMLLIEFEKFRLINPKSNIDEIHG